MFDNKNITCLNLGSCIPVFNSGLDRRRRRRNGVLAGLVGAVLVAT